MDITGGIVGLANSMSAQNTSTSHGMIMAKKALDQVEQQGANLTKMMESMEVPPVDVGQTVDIRI